MIGKGVYDDAASVARQSTKGKAVILIVFDGEHGNGFSAQLSAEYMIRVPSVLRTVAAQIEQDRQSHN